MRDPACQATFVAHRPSALSPTFVGCSRQTSSSFCIPTPLPSSPARCLRARVPRTRPGAWELPEAASHARTRGPRGRRRLGPARPRPTPPLPSSAAESPDVGFHPCAWSFISIKGQRSAGPRLRPPPPPAALPRGARRPGPHQSARRPPRDRAAGEEPARRGRRPAAGGAAGRGPGRGEGVGRGPRRRDSISGGGRLRFPPSSDAGAASLACCRGSRA